MLSIAATVAVNNDTPVDKVARRALLTDRWYDVVDSDGREIGGHWFEIHEDGRFVGQTMCGNSFQSTIEWAADNGSHFDATTDVGTMTAAGEYRYDPIVARPGSTTAKSTRSLSDADRIVIAEGLRSGRSKTSIPGELGRSVSSVCHRGSTQLRSLSGVPPARCASTNADAATAPEAAASRPQPGSAGLVGGCVRRKCRAGLTSTLARMGSGRG